MAAVTCSPKVWPWIRGLEHSQEVYVVWPSTTSDKTKAYVSLFPFVSLRQRLEERFPRICIVEDADLDGHLVG